MIARRFRLALAVLLLGAAGMPRGAGALDASEQMDFADGVYARGLWDVALKEYEVTLALVTNTVREAGVLFRMGECQRALGRTNEALTLFLRAGALPTAGEYRFRSGLRRVDILESTGNVTGALQLAGALMQANPTGDLAAACQYTLGSLRERTGDAREAAASYGAVLERFPASPFASIAALALGNLLGRQDPGAARAADLYAFAATNAASPRVGAEAWFQLGEHYFRQRQFERSVRAYERLASLYPTDERVADSRLQRAWASHHAGLYTEALSLCDAALKGGAGERQAEWLYLKANCERQLLQNEAALQTYGALLRVQAKGDLADLAGYESALVLFKAGRFAEAAQQARGLNPNPRTEKDSYWLLAECGAALHDDAMAVQYYRLLSDKFPRSDLAPDAVYRLGHLLQKKGEWVQAAEWFNRLASDYATHALAPKALLAAGFCENKAGRAEPAVRAWARLIDGYPQSPLLEDALYQKAMAEVTLKRDAQSLVTWRLLLDKYPGSRFAADAWFWTGVLLEESGKWDESEKALRSAREAKPAAELDARIRFRLALVLQRRNQPDESATLLQGLIGSSVTNALSPELLEWLSDYHLGRKDYAKAVEAAALLTRRADTEAWQQIAWCLSGKALLGAGRRDEARTAFEKAVALSARTQAACESWLRLGDLALQAGDPAAAGPAYEKAVTLAATDAVMHIRMQGYAGLGRTLKARGDLEGAARHFLSVGVLFDDPAVVPECLYEAAEAYAKLGRSDDSAKVAKDLVARYPTSEWAKKMQGPR